MAQKIRNKKTGVVSEVTDAQMEAMKSDQTWSGVFELVQQPPTPPEVKTLVEKETKKTEPKISEKN